MKEKGKQDKDCATGTLDPPERTEAQAGNPLCFGGDRNISDNRARRYIRITDTECWQMIDKISQDEKYKNSFNKIINDALFYGLPLLYEKLYGVAVLSAEESPLSERKISRLEDKQFAVMIRLLKETVLNVTINKSILSSLFHGKCLEYKGGKVDAENFENGIISDTPDYLYDYEMDGLKKLRR